jgi:anti-sigma factor RsiW
VIDLSRSCSRHRLTLVDFVDRGEVRPETAAALAHLDRCTSCTEVVESTILTITALRRMGDEASGAEPPPDSWPRLRIRIQGWRRRPAVMSPLAGLAMSFAIVAVLVLPVRLGGTLIGPVATPLDQRSPTSDLVDRQIEAEYIASVHQGSSTVPGAADQRGSTTAGNLQKYPDNYHPTRKEVGPVEPNGRPPEAI